MNRTYIVGIAILPNEEIFNYVRDLEIKLAETMGSNVGLKQPPHIAIKSPFQTQDLSILEKYCEGLVQSLEFFKIEINGIAFFNSSVAYAAVLNNEFLDSLHKKILQDFNSRFGIMPGTYEGNNKVFHITLASGVAVANRFKEIMSFLEKEHPIFLFPADTIGILLKLDDDSWITHKMYQIKKS